MRAGEDANMMPHGMPGGWPAGGPSMQWSSGQAKGQEIAAGRADDQYR